MNRHSGPSSDPHGIAVVGAGYWGPNLARNFAASPRWDLRWVIDADASRARAVAGQTPVATDVAEALADPRVTAVAIATPPATHADIATAVLESGRHVLVEKPLADSIDAATKVVALADRLGLTLMCDHTYCYAPAVERIRSLIREGAVGDLLYVDSVRINLGLVQRDVDVLWDLAPHDLSILDSVLPESLRPVAVSAVGSDPMGVGQACVAYLTLHLPGDVLAHVHLNWLSPTKVRSTIIGGSLRTIVWDDLNPAQRLLVCDRGIDVDTAGHVDRTAHDDARVAYRTGDLVVPALREVEALRGVVDAFAASIDTGLAPPTDGWSGLRVLEMLEAASLSLSRRGAVIPVGGHP